jgi:hypothetical protein
MIETFADHKIVCAFGCNIAIDPSPFIVYGSLIAAFIIFMQMVGIYMKMLIGGMTSEIDRKRT